MTDSNTRLYPNKNKVFNNQIVIDDRRVTLNKNEAVEATDKRGGFAIDYHNPSSENNFFYTEENKQYKYMHTKLYIFKKFHSNIDGITTNNDNIVGELVIEYTTAENHTKLYACYLLETETIPITDENDIDKLLMINERQEPTIEAGFDSLIPKQGGCIVYENDGNKVCVFTTPIKINTASAKKINDNFGIPTMFEKSPTEGESYSVVPGNYISKRDAEEIYIDCSPTGASEEEQNTYNIPINSKMATESQESDFMKTTVNYGIFVLAMIVSYITVPLLYKNLVVDGSAIAFGTNDIARFERIRMSDIILGFVMFALTTTLISTGASSDDYKLMSAGIFTFVFSILSYGLIQIKKTDLTFMTTEVKGTTVKSDQNSDTAENIDAIPFDDIIPTLSVILQTMINSDSLSAYFAVIITGILILTLLYALGSLTLVSYGNLSGIFAGVFVVVSIIIGLKKKFNAQVKVTPL